LISKANKALIERDAWPEVEQTAVQNSKKMVRVKVKREEGTCIIS